MCHINGVYLLTLVYFVIYAKQIKRLPGLNLQAVDIFIASRNKPPSDFGLD